MECINARCDPNIPLHAHPQPYHPAHLFARYLGLSSGKIIHKTCSMSGKLLKVFKTICLVLALGVSMSADAGLFGHTMSWKEEVLLHDGSKIIAERHYKLGDYPAIESHNREALDETVTFNLPGTNKKIVWKNDFRDSVPEPNSLNLIRLDVVKGVPYIATYPPGCIAYNKWGRPNPPQILLKYENEQWQRITLAELPSELIGTRANVIVGRPDVRIAKSFYTVEGVNAENQDIGTPEYKTILREAVKGGDGITSCLELTLYKGKWIMPNDPVMRAILDRKSK